MCQAYLESVSPECHACGGGYLAGLDNWVPHRPDCPRTKPKSEPVRPASGGRDDR